MCNGFEEEDDEGEDEDAKLIVFLICFSNVLGAEVDNNNDDYDDEE